MAVGRGDEGLERGRRHGSGGGGKLGQQSVETGKEGVAILLDFEELDSMHDVKSVEYV